MSRVKVSPMAEPPGRRGLNSVQLEVTEMPVASFPSRCRTVTVAAACHRQHCHSNTATARPRAAVLSLNLT
jgi:hypothetical protein